MTVNLAPRPLFFTKISLILHQNGRYFSFLIRKNLDQIERYFKQK